MTDGIETAVHWDRRYRTDETGLSWFEKRPRRSLELIEKVAPSRNSGILDVGGGASRLVDALLDRGYADLTVLDVSERALSLTRARLDRCVPAPRVTFLAADITRWTPARQWEVWHDRALFHFLVSENAQDAYMTALMSATRPGAHAIIAGFSLSGPERCSGLPVVRYDAGSLAMRLGESFILERHAVETHVTPRGVCQDFLYALFRRR